MNGWEKVDGRSNDGLTTAPCNVMIPFDLFHTFSCCSHKLSSILFIFNMTDRRKVVHNCAMGEKWLIFANKNLKSIKPLTPLKQPSPTICLQKSDSKCYLSIIKSTMIHCLAPWYFNQATKSHMVTLEELQRRTAQVGRTIKSKFTNVLHKSLNVLGSNVTCCSACKTLFVVVQLNRASSSNLLEAARGIRWWRGEGGQKSATPNIEPEALQWNHIDPNRL